MVCRANLDGSRDQITEEMPHLVNRLLPAEKKLLYLVDLYTKEA
jgi:hypothetical protein